MTELLDKKHKRDDFDCEKDLLNNYLKNQAGQDVIRKLSLALFYPTHQSTSFRVTIHFPITAFRSIIFQTCSEEITTVLRFYSHHVIWKISH